MASVAWHHPEPQAPKAASPARLRRDADALSDALDAIAGFVADFE